MSFTHTSFAEITANLTATNTALQPALVEV
jgi:hypothetical protein